MEIERDGKRKCCEIRDIYYGDCFDWNEHIFIRVKKGMDLAGVNLENGCIVYFPETAMVRPVNGKFVER